MKLDAHKLVRARQAKGMSQRVLAERAGLTTPTISRAERGFGVHPENALRIATALEKDLEELMIKEAA